MCYTLYISTDSQENLFAKNTELVRFERLDKAQREDPCIALLEYPNRWYVGSKSVCSCTFRHLYSVELGFGKPEDWFPEEQDELDATVELYTVISSLLVSGYHVDLIDGWYGATLEEIKTIEVDLDQVSQEAFRLFENHKFRLKKTGR